MAGAGIFHEDNALDIIGRAARLDEDQAADLLDIARDRDVYEGKRVRIEFVGSDTTGDSFLIHWQ